MDHLESYGSFTYVNPFFISLQEVVFLQSSVDDF